MRLTDFDVYKELMRDKAGILVTPDKTALFDTRLGPVAKRWGYASVELMTLALKAVPEKQLVYDIIEAVTDHETSFFRDLAAFEFLRKKIIPYFQGTIQSYEKLKLWSIGCATGQEAYSLAIALKETAPAIAERKSEILASDISSEALNRAREGTYSQYEVQRGLPIRTILRDFTQNGENWQIAPAIRKMIRFDIFNFMSDLDKQGEFHVIFCHNILKTFDPALHPPLLEKLALHLANDGFLFVNDVSDIAEKTGGHLVALTGTTGIYTRPGNPAIGKLS